MEDYIIAYQKLLAGEIDEWEGQPIKLLLHGTEWEKHVPLHIPLIMGGLGPGAPRCHGGWAPKG